MSTKTRFSLQDYRFFTSKKLAAGQTISDIAREQLPESDRSDKNIMALTRQIMAKNDIDSEQAKSLDVGFELKVPVIGQLSPRTKFGLQDYRFFTKKRLVAEETLADIARDLLPEKARSEKNIDALSKQIMIKNGLNEAAATSALPAGTTLTLPVIGGGLKSAEELAKQGHKSDLEIYNFQQPEIWLRRWVSLMRSIKTTAGLLQDILPEIAKQQEMFEYYDESDFAYFPPKFSLTTADLVDIASSITGSDEKALPQTRSGLIQYILAFIRQESSTTIPEEMALTELEELRQHVAEARNELSDIYEKIGQTADKKLDYYRLVHARHKAESDLRREKERSAAFSSNGTVDLPAPIELFSDGFPDRYSGHFDVHGKAEPGKPIQFFLNNDLVGIYSGAVYSAKEAKGVWDNQFSGVDANGEWNIRLSVDYYGEYLFYAAGFDDYDSVSNTAEFNYESDTATSMSMVQTAAAFNTEWDLEFELRQLLVLYRLCWNLLVFVDQELGPRMAGSLPGSWQPRGDRFHPPTNLIHENLRRASIDVEIIQRAIIQRKREVEGEDRPLTRHGQSLLIADKLVMKSLAPFAHMVQDNYLNNDPINVITYYSENTHIRRLPYDRSALLVGIAYANVSRHQDDGPAFNYLLGKAEPEGGQESEEKFWPSYEFLAIPHEVGHYVYHHCLSKRDTTAAHRADPYSHWYEEIFADVYGCFISGPLTAMGMQGLLVSSSVRQMSRDDGEHPVPIFRPFIISEILRVLSAHPRLAAYQYENAPNLLDASWEDVLRMRGLIPKGTNRDKVTFPYIRVEGDHSDHYDEDRAANRSNGRPERLLYRATIEEVVDEVRPIIEIFVDFLATNANQNPWPDLYHSNLAPNLYVGEVAFPMGYPPEIPWSGDEEYLDRYDEQVKALVSLVGQMGSVPNPVIKPGEASLELKDRMPVASFKTAAEKELLDNLDDWGDSGPGGFGRYP